MGVLLSLREAAQQTGTNKSTIWRAIKSGRMSATRLDDGGFAIDPAELFRVFEPQQSEQRREQRRAGQGTTADLQQETTPATPATDELALKVAALDAEVRGLKELLTEVRQSRDQWQAQAEDWKTQTTRLTLALPAPAPGPVAALPTKRRWWPWRRAG
jgi:excisionase family DNA binding protein